MTELSQEAIPTRWSLLDRLKNAEDQESWREFFGIYRNLIHSVALRSGLTEAEADDVVQDTIIAVAKKMPGFAARPEAGSFKSFLLLITRRRIVDQFRKRLPASASPGRADETARTPTLERVPDPAGLDLDAVWDQEWEKNLIDAAMTKVKRRANLKDCQIYDLYVLKKWPAKKVMSTLGVNIGQVYLAKHRIASQLKKEINALKKEIR